LTPFQVITGFQKLKLYNPILFDSEGDLAESSEHSSQL